MLTANSYPQISSMCLKNILLILINVVVSQDSCSRQDSRVVRTTVAEILEPVYEKYGASMPAKCPLSVERDMYAIQEDHKYEESASKWVCRFCGKGFYEERFLDMHFDNRHADQEFKGPDAVCLADFCDIFRCEVVSKHRSADYWDEALCRDYDLHPLRHQCEDLLQNCLPEGIRISTRQKLFASLNESLCGFLTCAKFWDKHEEYVEPVSAAIYIMLFIILIVGLAIYYFMVFTHFYDNDLSTDEHTSDALHDHISGYTVSDSHEGLALRHRNLPS